MKGSQFSDVKTLGYTGHIQGINQTDFIGKSKNYFL